MKNKIIFISLFMMFALLFNPKVFADDTISIPGCMNQNAINYNPSATIDDGSCTLITPTPQTINLTIRDEGTVIGPIAVNLQTAGIISLNDSNGNTNTSLDADSVLSVINDAQKLNDGFDNINFIYEYGTVYLKCIDITSVGNECGHDEIGWQYVVNNTAPGIGMDQAHLSNGDSVYLYFGGQKFSLSNNSITTKDTLTVNLQNYHYQDNTWIPLINCPTGIINQTETCTVGITQPDPNNPYSPKEILTQTVNSNGNAIFSSIPTGSYNVGIKENYYYPVQSLTVTNPPTDIHSNASSGGFIAPLAQKPAFDTKKAFDFLISQQQTNGSFGEDIYTDWTALAFGSSSDYSDQKTKLANYFNNENFIGTNITDYERHSMALMSIGINPYDIKGKNYIKKITDSFDGKQFGDTQADNDDIFALIVLQNSGYTQDDKMIESDIDFILNKQKTDGSWDESVDLTGAGIEALSLFQNDLKINTAITQAEKYLKNNEKDNGAFGNVSSTTWVLQGMLATNEKIEDSTLEYLGTNQDTDGGIKDDNINNKIWETSYTLTSISGKTWNQIIQKFEKPKTETITKINPLLSNTIANSYKNTFLKQIQKFQKPIIQKKTETIGATAIPTIKNLPKEIKTQNNFLKILKRILNFIF